MSVAAQPIARPRRLLPRRFPVRGIVIYTAAILAFFYLLGPFAWVVISSFMDVGETTAVPPHFIPQQPTLTNYRVYFDQAFLDAVRPTTKLTVGVVVREVPVALKNSIVVALCVAVINVIVGAITAYPFARLRFPGRVSLMVVYLVTRMIPGLALILPIYLVMRQLKLLDSIFGLVVMYLSFTLPYTVWILKNYIQTIPKELEEAAYIDGANLRQALVRVILPISVPGLVTVGMFAFMGSWGEFFFALLLTSTLNARTMPVEASNLTGELGTEYGFLMAGSVLAIIPPLILALAFQRVIIHGIAAGALKG